MRRSLKTLAGMRDCLKRTKAHQSSAAGNNIIGHPGNVFHVLCVIKCVIN